MTAVTFTEATVLLAGLAYVESPRWHDGRLWFAHWGAGEIVAVDLEGRSEVVGEGRPGLGWSIDWLPDGRLLTTGAALTRLEPDGTQVTHGDLASVASHGWNEIVVDGRGNVYVNGFDFDFLGGGTPKPGIIALVGTDGSTRQVADDIQFPNGMVITPDKTTLIVAESFARRLTAFTIEPNGDLSSRRVWADGVGPDGITMDADGAIWTGAGDTRMFTGLASSPAGSFVRVREGGEVLSRIELDRSGFACTLGGPDGMTLFLLAADWRGIEQVDAALADRTGQVLIASAPSPHAGRP